MKREVVSSVTIECMDGVYCYTPWHGSGPQPTDIFVGGGKTM